MRIVRLTALAAAPTTVALLVVACGHRASSGDAGAGAAADASLVPEPLDAGAARDALADADADAETEADVEAAVARPITYKTVLLCGDSQVGYGHGLTRALEARFRDAGVTKYRWDAFTSASVQGYDDSDRLPKLVAKLNPDAVFITIGSNNVQNPHPEGLAGNVRSIAKKAKAGNPARDCFILGPPLPIKGVKKDTGIIQVLSDNAAPCRFFDTSKLELSRQKDHIHPDDPGGEAWAAALWTFMESGKEKGP